MMEKINLNRLVNSFLNASFKKKVVAALLVLSVILALGWAAQQGVNISLNLEVQARLDYLETQQQILNETINNPINSTISGMVKTCSYILSLHGSYACVINGTDDRGGRLEYYSTDHSLAWNTARGYLGTMASGAAGLIWVRHGTYNVSSDWILGKKTHLVAEVETYLNVTTNLALGALVVDPSDLSLTDWRIEGVIINMNGYAGDAIYAGWAGHSSFLCRQTLNKITIGQVAANYHGLMIYNPFAMFGSQIRISTLDNGIGVEFKQNFAFNVCTGNSVFSDLTIGTGSGGKGLVIETAGPLSNSSKNPANLITFDRLQMGGGAYAGAGSVALNITNRGVYGGNYLVFINLDIENYETGILLVNASDVHFYGGMVSGADSDCAVNFTGNTNLIDFFGTDLDSWRDYTDGTRLLTMYGGHLWGTTVLTDSSHFSMVLDNTPVAGRRYYTTEIGSTSGCTNATWIAHNLDDTPTIVDVHIYGYAVQTYPLSVYCIARNSTHFQVAILKSDSSVPSGTWTIDWEAKRLIAGILDG